MRSLLVLLAACAHRPAGPAPAARRPDCPTPVADPAARTAEGLALLERARQGEHLVGWEAAWGMRALREAALSGHAPALSAWGRARLGMLYLDRAPDPDSAAERLAYAEALAAIAAAARLGDEDAREALPGPILDAILGSGTPPPPAGEDAPMADLPRSWLDAARVIALHDLACWGVD